MGGGKEMSESLFSWKRSFPTLILVRFSLFLCSAFPTPSLLCFLLLSNKSIYSLLKYSCRNIWKNPQTLCLGIQSFCPQTCMAHSCADSVFWSLARALYLPTITFANSHSLRKAAWGHHLSIDAVFPPAQCPREKGWGKRCLHTDSPVKSQNTLAGLWATKTLRLPISAAFGTSQQFVRLKSIQS